jgi:hypothetical protein
MTYESPYGRTGESWFWRAWPNESPYDFDGHAIRSQDFRLKSDARDFAAHNGGGSIRKMRFRGQNSTESRSDSINVEAKARVR